MLQAGTKAGREGGLYVPVLRLKELAAPWYSDQVLPFDVTLAGNNEHGAATAMRIYGIEILNEGSGVSIDDAVTEMQATFVARYVQPWHVVQTRVRSLAERSKPHARAEWDHSLAEP